jgi:DNA-directed RNA polymerase subunit RPC12/RpoP
LEEVGPYKDDNYPYMNFECPQCGFSICEWTDCPECSWYDEDLWTATMAAYIDCMECGQTVPESAVYLCADCRDEYHVVRSPEETREVLQEDQGLGDDE